MSSCSRRFSLSISSASACRRPDMFTVRSYSGPNDSRSRLLVRCREKLQTTTPASTTMPTTMRIHAQTGIGPPFDQGRRLRALRLHTSYPSDATAKPYRSVRHLLVLVASRQDVLEATTGCITKDVLEACALERAPLRGGPAGGFTSFRIEGLSFDSSSSRAWQAARSRLSWAGFRPR